MGDEHFVDAAFVHVDHLEGVGAGVALPCCDFALGWDVTQDGGDEAGEGCDAGEGVVDFAGGAECGVEFVEWRAADGEEAAVFAAAE